MSLPIAARIGFVIRPTVSGKEIEIGAHRETGKGGRGTHTKRERETERMNEIDIHVYQVFFHRTVAIAVDLLLDHNRER